MPHEDLSVSVVTSTFNRAALLRVAIDSALGQTEPPAEIIIVDDGSTDETTKVAASYAGGRTEVRYVRNPENRGPDFAAQVGVEKCRGRYVAFLDSDDVWLPEHLLRCVGALEERPQAVMVFTRYGVIDASGRVSVKRVEEPRLSAPALPQLLFKQITVTPSRSVFRREALLSVGGVPQLGVVHDWVLNVLVASKFPNGIVQLPELTALMREHEANSYSRPEVLRDDLLRGAEYIFTHLPPDWRRRKRRVVAVCLLTSALFFWRAGRAGEAWRCLGKAMKCDPTCVTRAEFREALTRLTLPPWLGRTIRDCKRGLNRRLDFRVSL